MNCENCNVLFHRDTKFPYFSECNHLYCLNCMCDLTDNKELCIKCDKPIKYIRRVHYPENVDELLKMIQFLEKEWNFECKNYNCPNCLKKAYNCVINDTNGYITDDELIVASNYKLKHL